MTGIVLWKSHDVEIVLGAGGLLITCGIENEGVGAMKGYIYFSSCDLTHILWRVDWRSQNRTAIILNHHQAPHECGASRHNLVPVGRTVCHVWHCFGITYHFYHSDLVHRVANWVALKFLELCKHQTSRILPSGGHITHNWCHQIENTSLFTLQCILVCLRGMSTRKLKIYTIDSSKYCAKNKCNNMIITPRRNKHRSSSANWPADISVTVNMNAEFNLSLIRWQLTPGLNTFQGISSPSIVRVWSHAPTILLLPFWSNPHQVAQIVVYLACCCVCNLRI
jgi:hypothetical protein